MNLFLTWSIAFYGFIGIDKIVWNCLGAVMLNCRQHDFVVAFEECKEKEDVKFVGATPASSLYRCMYQCFLPVIVKHVQPQKHIIDFLKAFLFGNYMLTDYVLNWYKFWAWIFLCYKVHCIIRIKLIVLTTIIILSTIQEYFYDWQTYIRRTWT